MWLFWSATKKSSGKYQAVIWLDGKNKYLGSSYDTAKQAAEAYDKEAIKLRRSLSKLNFPKKAPIGYTPIQQPLRITNTLGYRGVYKKRKDFTAEISIDGKKHYFTGYDTAKEAAMAYDRAVLKSNRSTSLLNFPDMVHNFDVEPKRNKQKVQTRNKTGYTAPPALACSSGWLPCRGPLPVSPVRSRRPVVSVPPSLRRPSVVSSRASSVARSI